MLRYFFLTLFVIASHIAGAQQQVEMADTMRSNGKIYVVVGIILIILAGLFAYLFSLDKKVSRLEKHTAEKPRETK